MHKERFMKTSWRLWLCRILIFLLVASTLFCFVFAFVETRTVDDITEEERADLMKKGSFRDAVRALSKMNEFNSQLSLDDVIYIKTLRLNIKYGLDANKYSLVQIGTENSSSDLYLDLSREWKTTDEKTYTELYRKYYMQGETVYKGLELKLLKEVSASDEVDELLKTWRKEELKSYQTVARTVWMTDVSDHRHNITSISSIITENACVIRVICSPGQEYYYIKSDMFGGRLMETDREAYTKYSRFSDAETEVYTKSDIQMILESVLEAKK